MSPDTPQERIGRLEQEMAAMRQRADDTVRRVEVLDRQFQGFAPLVVSVAEMRIEINRALNEASRARAELEEMVEKQDDRDEQARRDRKHNIQWFLGTMLIFCSLIVAAVGLLAGG